MSPEQENRPRQHQPICASDAQAAMTTWLMQNGSFAQCGIEYRRSGKSASGRSSELVSCERQLRECHDPALRAVIDLGLAHSRGRRDEWPAVLALTHLVRTAPSATLLHSLLDSLKSGIRDGWSVVPLIEGASLLAREGVQDAQATPELVTEFAVVHQWMNRNDAFSGFSRFPLLPAVLYAIDHKLPADALFAFTIVASRGEAGPARIFDTFRLIGTCFDVEDRKFLYNAAIRTRPEHDVLRAYLSEYRECRDAIRARNSWSREFGDSETALEHFRNAADAAMGRGSLNTRSLRELLAEILHERVSVTDLTFLGALCALDPASVAFSELKEFVPSDGSIRLSADARRRFVAQSCGSVESVESAYRRLSLLTLEDVIARCPDTHCHPSAREKKILMDAIDLAISRERRIPLAILDESYRAILTAKQDGRQSLVDQAFTRWEECISHGLVINNFPQQYLLFTRVPRTGQQEQLFLALQERQVRADGSMYGDAGRVVGVIADAPGTDQLVHNLLEELQTQARGYPTASVFTAARDAAINCLATEYQRDSDPHRRTGLLWQIQTIAGGSSNLAADTPAGVLPRAERVMRLQARIATLRAGFYGLAADAEHSHAPGGLSVIERMAAATGTCSIIHSEDIRGNPGGPGVLVSNVQLDRVLVQDRTRPHDPFHAYKEAWPEYASILDTFSRTHLGYLRGSLVLVAPGDEQMSFTYPGTELPMNYGLVAFNGHHGSLAEGAFLVHINILSSRILPCLYTRGARHDQVLDINSMNLTPRHLSELSKISPLAVINLSAGNNVTGGFANAFGARAPHLEQLRSARPSSSGDNYGYPDFDSMDFAHYVNQTPQVFNSIDTQVAQIAERALNYLDIHLMVLSQFKKGYIHSHSGTDSAEQAAAEQDNSISFLSSPDQRHANRQALRLLEEARAYRVYSREKQHRSGDYRVLALCSTENLSAIPSRELYLDTETGILSVDGVETELNLDSLRITPEDRMVWMEQVMPRLDPYFKTLRFYRKDIFSSHYSR